MSAFSLAFVLLLLFEFNVHSFNWNGVEYAVHETTIEIFDGTPQTLIWHKVLSCNEGEGGGSGRADWDYPDDILNELAAIATTVKIVPPGSKANSLYDDFAVIAKPDSTSVTKMKTGGCLATPNDESEWIGSKTAVSRIWHANCGGNTFVNQFYFSNGGAAQIHISRGNQWCYWDWRTSLGQNIEVYFGFSPTWETYNEITFETFDGTTEDIGWKLMHSCVDHGGLVGWTSYYNNSYRLDLAQKAISIKFTPPGSKSNSLYNDYAVIAKPWSDSVTALNSGRCTCTTTDITSGWIANNSVALNRLFGGWNCNSGYTLDQHIYWSNGGSRNIHLSSSNGWCKWDWTVPQGVNIEIYFGFPLITDNPTPAPTKTPTDSPTEATCLYAQSTLDTVFVVDRTDLTDDYSCSNRQTFIASVMEIIKDIQTSGTGPTNSRLSYIPVDSFGISVEEVIDMIDTIWNTNTFTKSERIAYRTYIETDPCQEGPLPTGNKPDLIAAINAAISQFGPSAGDSDNIGHDKKIIIFNTDGVTDSDVDIICDTFTEFYDGYYIQLYSQAWPHCTNLYCFGSISIEAAKILCNMDSACIGFSWSTAGGCLKRNINCLSNGFGSSVNHDYYSKCSKASIFDSISVPIKADYKNLYNDCPKRLIEAITDINFYFVNFYGEYPIDYTDAGTYIKCLVEYDFNRIITFSLDAKSNYDMVNLRDKIDELTTTICTEPTDSPTITPTHSPTIAPTYSPTDSPTIAPTDSPTDAPSNTPSSPPSPAPSLSPTSVTNSPTLAPSGTPTQPPSLSPSTTPTQPPSMIPTSPPSIVPSLVPSLAPSLVPTIAPTNAPSLTPTSTPTQPPTTIPSNAPSIIPSLAPSISPTIVPSNSPTQPPSLYPSINPSLVPSLAPTNDPSLAPSISPTLVPSLAPTNNPSLTPSVTPTTPPTSAPGIHPTWTPTISPSLIPTTPPSNAPSITPSNAPSIQPSIVPSNNPSLVPSVAPSNNPSLTPSNNPSLIPSLYPSISPSLIPSNAPSIFPSLQPSISPSIVPSLAPSLTPTQPPSNSPSIIPSLQPSISPSLVPSLIPSLSPTLAPTTAPTMCLEATIWMNIKFKFNRLFRDENVLLYGGESIISRNCLYMFKLKHNGNLVFYYTKINQKRMLVDVLNDLSNDDDKYDIIWQTNISLINDYDNIQSSNIRFEFLMKNLSIIEDFQPEIQNIPMNNLWISSEYMKDVNVLNEISFEVTDNGCVVLGNGYNKLWEICKFNMISSSTQMPLTTSQDNMETTSNDSSNIFTKTKENNQLWWLLVLLILVIIVIIIMYYRRKKYKYKYIDNNNGEHVCSTQISMHAHATRGSNTDTNQQEGNGKKYNDDNDDDDDSESEQNAIDEWVHTTGDHTIIYNNEGDNDQTTTNNKVTANFFKQIEMSSN